MIVHNPFNTKGIEGRRWSKSGNRRKRLQGAESLETRSLLTTGLVDVVSAEMFYAGDPDANDYFGFATAMTDDGQVAVVGANHDDELANSSGAAYVFHHDGTSWQQVQKLTSPTPSAKDEFGSGVAIIGSESDFTVVVGTETEDVFVFEGSIVSQTNFNLEHSATLEASNAEVTFGQRNSVSVSRITDANNNVVSETIVVGDSGNDSATRNAGAAFVFENSSDTWKVNDQAVVKTPDQTLYSDSPSRNEDFGWSVAISQDGTTIAVGARSADEVHVFENANGTFVHQAAFPGAGGWDVDLSHDASVLVTSSMWDSFVVDRGGTSWSALSGTAIDSAEYQLPESYADPETTGVRFGWTVDINEAGDTIAIGAASNSEHTAFAFSKDSDLNPTQGFGELARFAPPEGSTLGNLATAATNGDVALFGNQFHDGTDGSLRDSGVVHVFDVPSFAPTPGITVSPNSGLQTSEDGGTASFDVVLDTQPTADVTITFSSSDTSEGMVSPSSLTFTSTNWDSPQSIVVTGQDDVVQDGDVAYTITSDPASSLDSAYNGLDAADVSVTNLDNESPAVTTVYVNDLDATTTTRRGNKWNATVVISVQDTNGGAVPDATVSGTWSNGASGSSSCTTDANGDCSVSKNNLKHNVNGVTFTVDSITGTNLSYDSSLNSDPDGDSDGTAIHISQPGVAAVAAAIVDFEQEQNWLELIRGKRSKLDRIDAAFARFDRFDELNA